MSRLFYELLGRAVWRRTMRRARRRARGRMRAWVPWTGAALALAFALSAAGAVLARTQVLAR